MSTGTALTCSCSECPWEVHARGLCQGHYAQAWQGQELRPLRPRKPNAADPLDWAGRRFIVTEEHPTCWTWPKAAGGGRGYVTVDGRDLGITRFIWSRLVEPVPDDHDADHLCENVLCANVAHLQVIPKPVHRGVTVWRRRELKRREELEPGAELVWTAPDRPLPTSEALGFAMRHGLPFWMLGGWRHLGGLR